jgi:Rab GDP dissociation inhibitor
MFSSAKNVICKVPATDSEALKSPLMGLFEKKRLRNFYIYLDKLNLEDTKTWGDNDLRNMTMEALFKKFSLEENTVDNDLHKEALGYTEADLYVNDELVFHWDETVFWVINPDVWEYGLNKGDKWYLDFK